MGEKKGDKETTTEMKKADLMKMLKKKKDLDFMVKFMEKGPSALKGYKRKAKKSSNKKSKKTRKSKRKSRKKRKARGLDIDGLELEGLTLVGGKKKRKSKKSKKSKKS